MAPEPLSDSAALEQLSPATGWTAADGVLHCEARFEDFSEAFAFMVRVAFVADRLDHHPDWSNSYNTVTIDVTTHSKGGLTTLDVELAGAIDALVAHRG